MSHHDKPPRADTAPTRRVKARPARCQGWGELHRWAPDVYPLDDDGHIGIHLLQVPPEHAEQASWGAGDHGSSRRHGRRVSAGLATTSLSQDHTS